MRASERAILRIREEMSARKISQRDLADSLTNQTDETWLQPRLGKILTNQVEVRIDDLAVIAEAVGLTLAEATRDRGLEFFAEMAPIELRVLEAFRRRSPDVRRAFMVLLGIPVPIVLQDSKALTKSVKRKVGRPLKSRQPPE